MDTNTLILIGVIALAVLGYARAKRGVKPFPGIGAPQRDMHEPLREQIPGIGASQRDMHEALREQMEEAKRIHDDLNPAILGTTAWRLNQGNPKADFLNKY